MDTWTTKSGLVIPIADLTLCHAKNIVSMLIREQWLKCIATGARYAHGLDVDKMTEAEIRAHIRNRTELLELVARKAYGNG